LSIREFNSGSIRRLEITGPLLNETGTISANDPLARAFSVFDYMFELLKQQFKRYFIEKLANSTDHHDAARELLRNYELPGENVAIIRQLDRD
jgi:hypothetical protein